MQAPGPKGARELSELGPGQGGQIVGAREGPSVPKRLRELGLVPGTEVIVVRRGALGDPIELELRGYRVCVRRADLAGIRVGPAGG